MTPDPLRNAYNAERPIQIRLELGLAECHQLQHWLTNTLQADPGQDDYPGLQSVLTKLNQATDQAVRRVQCPVCQAWFGQGVVGRSGQYCSPACKQKAYRQRRNARQRQRPPSKRRY